MSRTVSEVIDQKLLPEKQLSAAQVKKRLTQAQVNILFPPKRRQPVKLQPEDCPHVKRQKKL